MGQSSHVLKFSRSDEESQYVLVRVTQKGSKPLDLKVEATEGEAEYATTLKHDKVASLRVKNCPASESQWAEILEKLFHQEPQSDIQATATVQAGSSVSIIIRKQIQGITQRLGALTISKGREGDINVLDWCATAVDATAEGKILASNLTDKVKKLEDAVDDLRTQLEELLRAKSEDETSLLVKFRDLLNEKKVKIREQQKIINSLPAADEDEESNAEAASEQPAAPPKKGKAGPSRPTKRKAQATPVVDDSSDSDDAAEPMEVDNVKEEPQDTDRDTETDSGMSDTSGEDVTNGSAAVRDSNASSVDDKASGEPQKQQQPKKNSGQPPPRRDLPFGNRKPPNTAAAPVKTEAGSETESDDEL